MRPRTKRRTTPVVVILAVLALGAGAVLYVRSRGEDPPSAAEVNGRQPMCDRLRRLSSLVDEVSFSAPAAAPTAASTGLARLRGEVDDLGSSAPAEVRDEVRDLVGGLRSTSTDPAATGSAQFTQARQDLQAYLIDPENGCQGGGESADG